MHLLDTQIISYAYKGNYPDEITRHCISSITAKEFLLIQGNSSTKANYYLPLPRKLRIKFFEGANTIKVDRPFSKKLTDQIVLEFGNDYPAIVEFGNLAVSEIINLKLKRLFDEAIRFLDKEQRKDISRRFKFLINKDISCISLNETSAEIGLSLFYEFTSRYNIKENIKNTINDVLILATSISKTATLITKDSLLNRFASEQYSGTLKENSDFLSIDFQVNENPEKRDRKESKGYINKGWQYCVRNYQGVSS